jgi:enoyl-CoA hydratase/carnithine racemase
MEFKNVIVQKKGPVATLTLNRPGERNALNIPMVQEMWEAIQAIKEDKGVRVLIVTGAGKAFCGGGDVNFLLNELAKQPPLGIRDLLHLIGRPIVAIRELEIPVIAAINGAAVGAGFDLLLHCDFRIAAKGAMVGPTWILNGVIPVVGSMVLLPKFVGVTQATDMILRGRMVDADEGYRIGLHTQVVPPEELIPTCEKIAEELAAGPPLAMALAKKGIQRGLDGRVDYELGHALYLQTLCMTTEDFKGALKAFLDKQKPQFKGR